MKLSSSFRSLSRFERSLWLISLAAVTLAFIFGGDFQPLTLAASLIGVTALIFVARGDVLGQALTVIFSLLYAVISFKLRYYGEMITYLGMTAPIAVLSIITWLRNPYEKNPGEVKVARLGGAQYALALLLAGAVTAAFYFILKFFGNANLVVSTISVTTSFLASYLTMKRSPLYALAYAANDIVLIVLWVAATLSNGSYLPMTVCFTMFLCNDFYGYINWRRMERRQSKTLPERYSE